jgi:uncharacterized protein YbaA (DUF1428 family)
MAMLPKSLQRYAWLSIFTANPMPFDGKRLIYGGFEVIVEA